MIWWIALGWLSCSAVVIFGERLAAKHDKGIVSRDDGAVQAALTFGTVALIAPALLAIILVMVIRAGPLQVLRIARGLPIDPFKRPEEEWLAQGPDGFAYDLVRRREVKDQRLKSEKVSEWPGWRTETTPDAMILDVISKHHALKDAGLDDSQIFARIDAHRFDKGEGQIPSPCDLGSYITYRLGIEDPGYLDLGSGFIREQIVLCEKYIRHRAHKRVSWPPQTWLRDKIDLLQFERSGTGIDPMAEGSPAALTRGGDRIRKDLLDLKFLMLPSDELWTFSSPPDYWAGLAGRAGIALVRAGRSIGHVITSKN